MESPCKGGLDVSEKALISMLGSDRFSKRPTVSYAEQKKSELLTALGDASNDIGVAAARLGLSKSSLKRMLASTETSFIAYDEANPIGKQRRYLEKNMGKWTVSALSSYSGNACIEMKSPSGTVRLSVTVDVQRFT